MSGKVIKFVKKVNCMNCGSLYDPANSPVERYCSGFCWKLKYGLN